MEGSWRDCGGDVEGHCVVLLLGGDSSCAIFTTICI